jgi:iron complex transport system permease protein
MSNKLKLFILFGLLIVSFMLCLQIGAVPLTWSTLTDPSLDAGMSRQIFVELRLPRLLLGILAGASLALCGGLLQDISRNQLADPYLFGIVAGAAFGATIATIWLPNQQIALPIAAFFGAVLAIGLVIAFVSVNRRNQLEQLVLAGVAVSFLLSSLGSALLYMGDAFAANRIMFWLMGSLARAEMTAVWVITPVLLLTILIVVFWRRELAALHFADNTAKSLGVEVTKVRLGLLLCTAALTAVVVAYCGGIGFVGLLVPHLIRFWLGNSPLPMLIGSALAGAILLIWVDATARTLLPNQEVPLGVLTSALGSLFFLVLLARRR